MKLLPKCFWLSCFNFIKSSGICWGKKKELPQSRFCLSEDEASGSPRSNCVVSGKLAEFKENRIRWFWDHCYFIKTQDHCQDQYLLFLCVVNYMVEYSKNRLYRKHQLSAKKKCVVPLLPMWYYSNLGQSKSHDSFFFLVGLLK